jgi:hypothetical protein
VALVHYVVISTFLVISHDKVSGSPYTALCGVIKCYAFSNLAYSEITALILNIIKLGVKCPNYVIFRHSAISQGNQ